MTQFFKAAAFGAATIGAAAVMPSTASAQALPAAVIAVVDTSRVANDCNACKVAAGQLQGMITQAQQRAQALGTPIQTEDQAIQTEARRVQALPAGAARTAAENALRQRAQALATRQQSAQQELQNLEQNIQSVRANVMRQINEKMNTVITQVMTARGANIAVDQQATLAATRGVDVTDQVLAGLNTALPTISVTPLPAAPATTAPARPTAPTGR